MGTSRSPEELARKLFHASQTIEGAARDGVHAAGLLVKASVQAELHGVTRLRGVGAKGAKIGVRYDVAGPTAVVVRMTGPAHLIERDTAAHEIGPKRRRALHLVGGDFRASVAHHPGTKGKHPFEHGVALARPLVPRLMMHEQAKSLRKVFA